MRIRSEVLALVLLVACGVGGAKPDAAWPSCASCPATSLLACDGDGECTCVAPSGGEFVCQAVAP